MQEDKIKKILIGLGLEELEITCYLALLKKSPQRASQLSLSLDIPKATILDAISQLVNVFNIVKQTKKKNFYLFSVEDPADILRWLEQKQTGYAHAKQQVTDLLPELRSLQQYDVNKPKIYYFEGKEGIRQVFWQVLDEADEIIGYGSHEGDAKYLSDIIPEYYEKRVAKKIPARAIVPALPFNIQQAAPGEKKYLRPTHLIPAEFNYPIQINVYKNTTIFFSFEENFALMIKRQPIAACLKKMFEFAFEYTKESDQEIRATHRLSPTLSTQVEKT